MTRYAVLSITVGLATLSVIPQIGAWWPAAGSLVALLAVRGSLQETPLVWRTVLLAAMVGGGLGALAQPTGLAPLPGWAGYAGWLLERFVRYGLVAGIGVGGGIGLFSEARTHSLREVSASPDYPRLVPWLVAATIVFSGVSNPIWTRTELAADAYQAAAWSDLVALVQAQERARIRSATFSTDLRSISFFPSFGVSVVVDHADSTSFSARASHIRGTAECLVVLDRARARQMDLTCDRRERRF
ncbi:MAG: hypothetical protein BMS9Abin29_2000 [Gemmatimonadota bacterium]|nr:MAG: hypothetical protein BMS9Abin29_2000 [Gemmatimonadota bacterium]